MVGIFLAVLGILAFFYFVLPSERKSPRGEYQLARKVFKDEDERPYLTF